MTTKPALPEMPRQHEPCEASDMAREIVELRAVALAYLKALRELSYRAQVVVAEDRREFPRGELSDVDNLEDAIKRIEPLPPLLDQP